MRGLFSQTAALSHALAALFVLVRLVSAEVGGSWFDSARPANGGPKTDRRLTMTEICGMCGGMDVWPRSLIATDWKE